MTIFWAFAVFVSVAFQGASALPVGRPSHGVTNARDVGDACIVTQPKWGDVWTPGATYQVDWVWEDPTRRLDDAHADGNAITSAAAGVPNATATIFLEKLNADGTWERVDSQPRVPIKGCLYAPGCNDHTTMGIVLSRALTEPLTTKIVLATQEYPSQLLCSSDEFTCPLLSVST